MIFKEQLSKIHDLEYVVKVVTVYQNQKDVWIFAPKNSWKVNDFQTLCMFLLKSFQMQNYTFFKSQLVFIFW